LIEDVRARRQRDERAADEDQVDGDPNVALRGRVDERIRPEARSTGLEVMRGR
jgi:hypothetical protein